MGLISAIKSPFGSGKKGRPDEDTAVLQEIEGIAAQALPMDELCERLASQVERLFTFDRLSLAFLDIEGGTFTEEYVSGPEQRERRAEAQPLSGTVVQEVVNTRSGVRVEVKSPQVWLARFPALKPALDAGVRSVLAVPLVHNDQVVAALTLEAADPMAYSEHHLELGQQIGSLIPSAVANSRTYTALRREALQESILAEIGRATSSAVDIDQAYEEVAEQVRRLVPYDTMVVALVDPEAQTLSTAFVAGPRDPQWKAGATRHIGRAALNAIAEAPSGSVVPADSANDLASQLPSWPFDTSGGLRAILTAPLVWRERALGALLFGSTGPDAYTERDVALADRIARALAFAVDNRQLHTRLRRQADEAEAIDRMAQALAKTRAIQEVGETVADAVRGLIPFHRLDVAAIEEDAELTHVIVSGLELPGGAVGDSEPLDGTMVHEAIKSRSPLLVQEEDPREMETRFPSLRPAVEAGLRSFVAAPLVSGDEVVGALLLGSTGPDAYTERDVALADRIARALAFAVANRQLHTRLRRQADEAEAIDRMARALAKTQAIQEVGETVADAVRGLIPFHRLDVAAVEGDAELTHVIVSGLELPGGAVGDSEPLDGTMVHEAIKSRSPLVVQEGPREMETRFPSLRPAVEAGLRSFIAAPLVSGDEVVGALLLGSTGPDAYTERDVALAERIAHTLASPAADARRRPVEGPDSRELATLAEIGRIVTSSVDIDEVYEPLTREMRRLVQFDKIAIWSVDLHRENLVASYVWGSDVTDLELGRAFPLKGRAAEVVLSARSGVALKEGSTEALATQFQELLRGSKAGLPSVLLVPLVSANETVGMLSLRSMRPNSYTEQDVAVAERIGAQIAGAVANAQVYAEYKEVEDAVREAVERMDLAVAGSDEGLWDWNIQDNQVWWSPRFKKLLGYQEQEEGAAPQGWEDRLHPEDRDRVLRALDDHIERGVPYDVEYRASTDSGEFRWFVDRGKAIRDEAGKAVRMSGALRDITDAKESVFRDYPGSIDLREPLAALEGFRQAMLEGRAADEDAGGQVFVARLAAVSRPMAHLIDDLRTLSWAMDSEVRREPVDLSAIARATARKLRRALGKRELVFSIAGGAVVEGDAQLLRVMMEHLLDNACKFTAKHPRARIQFGVTRRNGERVFHVRDDGAGFDTSQADRPFGLFQRLHPPGELEGTGVGLAIVRHILRRHGGSIWAEGKVEEGAAFYFTL